MENIQDLKSQLAQLEAQCKALEEQLRQAKELAVQKQFEVTKLNHAGFFQRHFSNLRNKKDAAWAEYRNAVFAADELKLALDAQKKKLEQLRDKVSQIG